MSFLQLKKGLLSAAGGLGIDSLFRCINKNKLLVLMYHGITERTYQPSVWTQLPVDLFRRQLEFFQERYVPISLRQVREAMDGNRKLPERAALITFDDGLKNNYHVAFPILKEKGIPAAIFLTVDFIDSDRILWVDELYLILCEAVAKGVKLDLKNAAAQQYFQAGEIWQSYEIVVESLKRAGFNSRNGEMDRLRMAVPVNYCQALHDFGILSWSEIQSMYQSGLIEFGVHTATHRILTELAQEEWDSEISAPKAALENKLGVEVSAFCYPNGQPSVDFQANHMDYLHKSGYKCAFTTASALADLKYVNPMAIGRIPAGNDSTSDMNFFRINTSGAIPWFKGIWK
jgi:peptidoglycan/xylan/chitin deacetylase (PgdA/CDA1 family)